MFLLLFVFWTSQIIRHRTNKWLEIRLVQPELLASTLGFATIFTLVLPPSSVNCKKIEHEDHHSNFFSEFQRDKP